MITGIEHFDSSMQGAILRYIANYVDLSEDVEIEEVEDNVISINGALIYIIEEDEQQRILTKYNTERFEEFFEDINNEQLQYVDKDKWLDDYGISSFEEWINEETRYSVEDDDYYGGYVFYQLKL